MTIDPSTRVRHELRRMLSPYPRVFLPLMRRRPAHRDNLIDENTEIVIEGFPRSGNTFAVAAFEYAQSRPVRIAHHLHAPAHVIDGLRRGLPVMLVLREPVEAVTSQVIRHPGLTVGAALRQYVSFHRHLLPYREQVTVALFEQVTSDFGVVIDALNERFGTSFKRFDHTPESVNAVFKIVDEMDRADITLRSDDSSATVARPTESRERLKIQMRDRFSDPKIVRLINSSRVLWNQIKEAST